MRRLALPSLLALVVGCSFVLQPADAIQCSTDQDCAAFASRVCSEGFCVPFGPTSSNDGGSESDASTEDPRDGRADADAGGTTLPLEPAAGDVVMLVPSGIVNDGTHVTEWTNGVQAGYLQSAVVPDFDASLHPLPFFAERHGQACVAFALYQRLVLADDSAGALTPRGDFSVMVVVDTPELEQEGYSSFGRIPVARVHVDGFDTEAFAATGWAVRTAWQNGDTTANQDRYAASLAPVGGTTNPQFAKEVVDPQLHDNALHVVTLLVRKDDGEDVPALHLFVDGVEKGAPLQAQVSQPATADLTLGSILGPPIQWTAFLGDVCTVIVHHGPQSDAELGARTRALKSQFGIP